MRRSPGLVAAAALAAAALAGCAPAAKESPSPAGHTGSVWYYDADSASYRAGVGLRVVVVEDADGPLLWEALYGTETRPEGDVAARALTTEQWQGLGEVVVTGGDGGFDVDVPPGEYWVCVDAAPSDAMPGPSFAAQGCDRGRLGDGEAAISSLDGPFAFDPAAPLTSGGAAAS